MAHSRFEYVRKFELDDSILPNTWIVVRIDGKNFHKFSDVHHFQKPCDERALNLMNACAARVMEEFQDVVVAYGQSDEFSFVLRRDSTLFSRRASKLSTGMVSLFSASYVFLWSEHMGADTPLQYPPCFDGRCVAYPSLHNLRDYLSWRQADCHINNLYNTSFWALVEQGGLSTTEAEQRLSGTLSKDKNELLFSEFGINYNEVSAMFRKGSTLLKMAVEEEHRRPDGSTFVRKRRRVCTLYEDIIGDTFWEVDHPDVLHISDPPGRGGGSRGGKKGAEGCSSRDGSASS